MEIPSISFPKAKRVAFLITDSQRGGAETQIRRIVSTLQKENGRELHIIAMLSPKSKTHLFSHLNGVTFHTLNMSRGKARPNDLLRTIRLLRDIQPDVLACFCFHANILGALAGKFARIPVVISSIRGERFGSRNRERLERALDWFGLRDVVTTNSRQVASSLINRRVTAATRTIVIPNGIRIQDYTIDEPQNSLRDELGIEANHFLWLAVGNLRAAKDYPTLLAAFQQLHADFPSTRLLIAGAFDTDDIVSSLRQHPLVKNNIVRLLGPRNDIPKLLKEADAFVLSSAHEGLPNAVMEALASATPVVCTDVGGIRELVQPGTSGFIAPPQEPRALSDAMAKMLSLPHDTRAAMGSAGQAHIASTFGLEVVVEQWDALFSSLLANKVT